MICRLIFYQIIIHDRNDNPFYHSEANFIFYFNFVNVECVTKFYFILVSF